jgi:hypothetical protein
MSDDFLCCSNGQWALVEDLGSAKSTVWGGSFDFALGNCSACRKNWMRVLPSNGEHPPTYSTIDDGDLAGIRAVMSYQSSRREQLLLAWFDKD